jgi:hypothetical protein
MTVGPDFIEVHNCVADGLLTLLRPLYLGNRLRRDQRRRSTARLSVPAPD